MWPAGRATGRLASGVDRASPPNPQIFGNAGIEHMEKYGTTTDHFAKIGWKNHKHRQAAARRDTACNPRLAYTMP